MPLAGLTSLTSLRSFGHLTKGSRVLILGGTTANGIMAIQLAKAYGGAAVIAVTASAKGAALATKLGATTVVDYRERDVFAVMRAKKQRFDLIYETVDAGEAAWNGAAGLSMK